MRGLHSSLGFRVKSTLESLETSYPKHWATLSQSGRKGGGHIDHDSRLLGFYEWIEG